MFDLNLQHFNGTSLDMRNCIEVKRIGRFLNTSHAWEKIETLLNDAETKGYIVEGTCYYRKDRKESFALQIVEQGVPLYD